MESLSIVEATIADLQHALTTNSITSVELVAKYLQRIATYDTRGPCLNSIVILNSDVFVEAAKSDARRAAGQTRGPLEGIPYTIKDSMKYKGMTCATGSPAFANLIANEDCFVVEQLRAAGAICIGRTNTPPMMASGMHRGVYGRAESPYNLEYLTAAFSSGSSNGAATSTAASFAAFGIGSETVSSGRSPASNNGLVAYTPSRTGISLRGTWSLYPTCDVLVPMTRTVDDMLVVLDVLTKEDSRSDGDFWREQKLVAIEPIVRPKSFVEMKATQQTAFKGKRVAVPAMYVGGDDPKAKPVSTSKEVLELWQRAKVDLEALGAEVVETDFPLVTRYEDDSVSGLANNVEGVPSGWNSIERGELVAYSWDDFLKANGDAQIPSFDVVNGSNIFPRPDGYIPDRWIESKNFMNYPGLIDIVRKRNNVPVKDIPGLAQALQALEAQRKRDLEDWMDKKQIDVVVFPANGDVGKANLEYDENSAKHALQNGVKYSNGNRSIRHMGVPTASVAMGLQASSGMPINLTFASKHGEDAQLMAYASAFEHVTRRRTVPTVTPALASDRIELQKNAESRAVRSDLRVNISSIISAGSGRIRGTGTVVNDVQSPYRLEITVDGVTLSGDQIKTDSDGWSFETTVQPFKPTDTLCGGYGLAVGKKFVTVVARTSRQVAAEFVLSDAS